MPGTKSRKTRPSPNTPIVLRRARGRLRVRRPQRETTFDLMSTVARDGIDPGMPEPGWPSGDSAFLTAVLRSQRVPEPLVQRISAAIPASAPSNTTLADRLAEALAIGLDFGRLEDVLNAPRVLLAGPAGAGKTTLAAKLAVRSDRAGVRFANAQAGRPGDSSQLAEYAATLGTPLMEAAAPEDLATAARANDGMLVVDTGGVDAADAQAWESLRPWIAAADATPLLVLPANAPVEDALTAARAFRALGGRHYIVTRFDMVRRVGSVLGAAMEGLALVAVSVTPHFAYGLRPLTADVLARRLLSGALDEARWQAPAA
jgi:flagellar biosynthesis protein FlhF